MKFTLSWLKEHIKITNNPSEIAKTLTDLGLEVENFQSSIKKLYLPKIVKT